jgi:hypothetical protein
MRAATPAAPSPTSTTPRNGETTVSSRASNSEKTDPSHARSQPGEGNAIQLLWPSSGSTAVTRGAAG